MFDAEFAHSCVRAAEIVQNGSSSGNHCWLPNEGAALRMFFELRISAPMNLSRVKCDRNIGSEGEGRCLRKKEFHDFSGKMGYSLFCRMRTRSRGAQDQSAVLPVRISRGGPRRLV